VPEKAKAEPDPDEEKVVSTSDLSGT